MKKFIIFAPSYNPDSGGIVCLHKLTHLINEIGCEAYLYPSYEVFELSANNFFMPTFKVLKAYVGRRLRTFRTNPIFNTPIINVRNPPLFNEDWIVIYPETVFGNPLYAQNIVRWLLHQPGFHTNKIYYGEGELHVRFNEAIKPFIYPNSTLADYLLPIIHYPLEIYEGKSEIANRSGTAYCIRKGRGKLISQDSKDILIDGLSHGEIANIFKRVERFISYDPYTAYSRLAALSGCDSIVVPDLNVKECDWYPNPADRYGVSYGFENIEKSRQSRSLLLPKLLEEHRALNDLVFKFIKHTYIFFKK